MYLTQIDFNNHQRAGDLDILSNSSSSSLTFAFSAAIEEMTSYLSMRYDVNSIFIDIQEYDNSKAYISGDQIFYNNNGQLTYYVCKNDSTGNAPTNTTYWTPKDNRNPFIVMIGVDIATYHLHTKIPERKTPEDVNDRYLDAKKWLEGVAKGLNNPSLPKLSDSTTPSKTITFGSKTKLENEW